MQMFLKSHFGFFFLHHYDIKNSNLIMLHQQNKIPRHSCHSTLLTGPLGCILCLHRADVCKPLQVSQYWCVHV